ncbi:MAG: MFS transporter [Acidimicrobiales bacterium]
MANDVNYWCVNSEFFGMAITVLLPLLVRQTLHASALDLGLVYASGGAAGVAAAFIVARLGAPRRRVTVLWSAYVAGGVAMAALAFSPTVLVAGLLMAIETGLILYGDVLWTAMIQEFVPSDVLGRVSSLIYLFAFSLGPLGILFGGVAASVLGTRHAVLLCGLAAAAVCLGCVALPSVRDPERDDFFNSIQSAEPPN